MGALFTISHVVVWARVTAEARLMFVGLVTFAVAWSSLVVAAVSPAD